MEDQFSTTVESLLKGMEGFITSKTVVGDSIKCDDGTLLLPLVDVSFGVGAGSFKNGSSKKDNASGAMGGKIQPSAVLVIKDGSVRLVNIKNQNTVNKIIDMVPDFVNKVKGKGDSAKDAEYADEAFKKKDGKGKKSKGEKVTSESSGNTDNGDKKED